MSMPEEQGPAKRAKTESNGRVSVWDTDAESRDKYQSLPESARTYELVKADVEQRFFRLCSPFKFCLEEKAGITLYPYNRIKRVIGAFVYFEKTKAGGWARRDFRSRWLRDQFIRTLACILFDPSRTIGNISNSFHGLAGEKLGAVGGDEVEALSAPVYSFIASLLPPASRGGVLCDWLANLVQHPGRMSRIAPILYGLDGCGHKLFIDWVRLKLIGEKYSVTGAKKATDFVEKLLIHVDTDQRMEKLVKFHITFDKLEARNRPQVQSHLNVIYTTTSEVTADPEWTNWRCSIFHCNDAPCRPDLEALLADPRVQRAFYQSLLERDITSYKVAGGWSGFVSRLAVPTCASLLQLGNI